MTIFFFHSLRTTKVAAALALTLIATAEINAAPKIDQSDPQKFIYDLYGCRQTGCDPNFAAVKWENYASSDLRKIFALLTFAAKSSPGSEGTFCDYDDLLYHTAGSSEPLESISIENRMTTPLRSVIIVTMKQRIAPNATKQEMPVRIVFYLIKEHGFWFIDDTVSENGSIRNDYLVCITDYRK